MEKVSFVCTTYRRFTCVERIIAQFHAQMYSNKELIILNTDCEYPFTADFIDDSITIVNKEYDMITGLPYTNRGQICRDAVSFATGEYFMLADDDDIYLPWHMQQAVDKLREVGTDAWKPHQSFFATPDKVELVQNTLEASVIVKMSRIREIGFRIDKTGYEGLSWYSKLRDEKQLSENYTHHVPSYCFNWSDPHELAGHKQSGNIDGPNNFKEHKEASLDYARRPIRNNRELGETYTRYLDYYKAHIEKFPKDMLTRYVVPHL